MKERKKGVGENGICKLLTFLLCKKQYIPLVYHSQGYSPSAQGVMIAGAEGI